MSESELPKYMRWLTRITYTLLAIGAVWMLIAPHHHPVILGIVLGTSVSCMSAYYLGYRVRKITDAVSEGRKARGGLGFAWRAIAAIAALVVAIEFPHEVNLIALMASLSAAPIILLIVGILITRKESKAESLYFEEKRREKEKLAKERGEKDA
ncbi:ATP synthase subunit I [Saccharibacillus sp. CPCC 101409]|uniref:ATP synthase subunit I n=1 Tax=Saccharibacillus sp. CPCC 101409 TaxID=3058041 RepID=UPI0026739D50|nr:ATP synthase subunit I [Saccharibacillus sp. CPCC 101409]MDO3412119.1 ATP synthase subunit I [Saccharibacillus sp. CPCC 101409]